MTSMTDDARMACLEGMRTAIFDMDGTILDSMGEWRRRNAEYIRRQGIEPTAEQRAQMMQLTGRAVVLYYQEQFGFTTDFDTLCADATGRMEAEYRRGLPQKPGAEAYLRRLRARGVLCVVATATPEPMARMALERAGLAPLLDHIFSVGMIGGGKGEADFYDRLAGMLGVDKAGCVMFEDAVYAMRGAREAGLTVVGVTDGTNTSWRAQMQEVCDVIIDSFDELP
ncbi:MAG: HAD family phosphatase [Clostridia bacterium]|nr:HAD family phosphatase [Clostridia bacterium]